MKRFLFLMALLMLAGAGMLPAQMMMSNLPEYRETYTETEHVPADAWEKPTSLAEIDPTLYERASKPIASDASASAARFAAPEQLEMAVFPNPTRNEASFRIALPEEKPIRLDLIDARGQLLRTIYENALQPKGELRQKLGLMGYPAGVYYLRIRIGEEMHSLPVVKQ